MPQLATRHRNGELLTFSDFTGGLNLSRPPENIADNEMQEAVNLEFAPDTGLLRVRGGLELAAAFDAPVTDIFPAPKLKNAAGAREQESILLRTGNQLHRVSRNGASHTSFGCGAVAGDKPASYELWGDGDEMLMAFGSLLYRFWWEGEFGYFETIETEGAPARAEILFNRGGRLIVAETGSDTIRYSGIGDPKRWTEGTDMDAVSVEVGYKDGCRMKAIASLAGELIVFKCPDEQPEQGRIYRLRGDYPDWSIVPYARGSSAWNSQTVANISSDLLFLTREGLANLGTAMEYGDFKMGWAGAKVNPALSRTLSQDCRMWHLPLRGQIWVADGTERNGGTIWCYHYQIGGGAWTTLQFHGRVGAVADMPGGVYVGIGSAVYRMSPELPDDDGRPIRACWKPRTLMRRNQTLVKGVTVGYQCGETARAKAALEGLEVPLPAGGADNIAVARQRCNIREWKITPEIAVENGAFTLSSLGLEVAEV